MLHPTALLIPLPAIEGTKTKRKEPMSNGLEMLSMHPSPPSCFQLPEEWVKLINRIQSGWHQSGDHPTVKLLRLYCRLSFSLLHSSIECIRGARSSKGHTINIPSSINLVHSGLNHNQTVCPINNSFISYLHISIAFTVNLYQYVCIN